MSKIEAMDCAIELTYKTGVPQPLRDTSSKPGGLSPPPFYGILQDYYASHPPFQQFSTVGITAVGTSSIAIQYREIRRLIALLQGVHFGIAGGVLYFPILKMLPQWFVRRRGLATGIIFAGPGIGDIACAGRLSVDTLSLGHRHVRLCRHLVLLWGFTQQLTLVFPFAIIYRGFMRSYTSLSPAVAHQFAGSRPGQSNIIWAYIFSIRRIAVVIGPLVYGLL
ncbi:hypothetical protein C8Q72DRAFT_793803 [Fomitopsis betulina]|nr:hypothetical protein C8Q72DRAFT_793803 [Fomitopsis betulina]